MHQCEVMLLLLLPTHHCIQYLAAIDIIAMIGTSDQACWLLPKLL